MASPSARTRKGLPADLLQAVDRLQSEAAEQEASKVYQLAFWPDHQRAMPTDFLACALFAAVHPKDARNLRGAELACINGYRVTFTGKMLTQVHADIVMGALQMMRGMAEGQPVVVRPRSFLRSIGRHSGKTDRDSFRQLIDDIIATAVRITTPDGRTSYSGSILTRSKDASVRGDQAFLLEVNRDLARVFLNGFGTVDWNQRKALLKKPLAQWLQLFTSRFSKPVQVAELHQLSRSSAPLRSFRRQLKLALIELERVGVGTWYVDETDVMRQRTEPMQLNAKPEPVMALVAEAGLAASAEEGFRARYPEHRYEACLAAWNAWSGSKRARNPEAAFLGFAKKWVAGGAR
jgi:hypothetical protein